MPCPDWSGWELGFQLFDCTHRNVQGIAQTPRFRSGESHAWQVRFDFRGHMLMQT
jgi:hypothetical protein